MEQVIQFELIYERWLARTFKCPAALQQGPLSQQGHIKGQKHTHTHDVWFNPKRHIDPNGRVFVSLRRSLMLMSL